MVVLISIVIIINLVEIEKPFVTFSSPETSYKYSELSSAKPEFVVDGQSSSFVVAYNKIKKTYSYSIVSKKGDRWTMKDNAKIVKSTIKDGIIINVYRCKNTDDYYLSICDIDFDRCAISDNRNSEFIYSDNALDSRDEAFIYYVYVKNINEQYQITVNGETIVFDD